MKIKFLADADLHKGIVLGMLRREPTVDFRSAQDVGLRGLNDLEVLALAAAQGRALVSHDVNTLPAHFKTFISAGNRSPGVFLIPQTLDIGTAINELLSLWSATESEEWNDRLAWLPL